MDVYAKPESVDACGAEQLGPLAPLAGRWVGDRGVDVAAGGHAARDARCYTLQAELGSETFGVLSNPFLDEAFKTVRFELKITVHGDDSFSYVEDTVLKIAGETELFYHTDRNTLDRA